LTAPTLVALEAAAPTIRRLPEVVAAAVADGDPALLDFVLPQTPSGDAVPPPGAPGRVSGGLAPTPTDVDNTKEVFRNVGRLRPRQWTPVRQAAWADQFVAWTTAPGIDVEYQRYLVRALAELIFTPPAVLLRLVPPPSRRRRAKLGGGDGAGGGGGIGGSGASGASVGDGGSSADRVGAGGAAATVTTNVCRMALRALCHVDIDSDAVHTRIAAHLNQLDTAAEAMAAWTALRSRVDPAGLPRALRQVPMTRVTTAKQVARLYGTLPADAGLRPLARIASGGGVANLHTAVRGIASKALWRVGRADDAVWATWREVAGGADETAAGALSELPTATPEAPNSSWALSPAWAATGERFAELLAEVLRRPPTSALAARITLSNLPYLRLPDKGRVLNGAVWEFIRHPESALANPAFVAAIYLIRSAPADAVTADVEAVADAVWADRSGEPGSPSCVRFIKRLKSVALHVGDCDAIRIWRWRAVGASLAARSARDPLMGRWALRLGGCLTATPAFVELLATVLSGRAAAGPAAAAATTTAVAIDAPGPPDETQVARDAVALRSGPRRVERALRSHPAAAVRALGMDLLARAYPPRARRRLLCDVYMQDAVPWVATAAFWAAAELRTDADAARGGGAASARMTDGGPADAGSATDSDAGSGAGGYGGSVDGSNASSGAGLELGAEA